MADPRNRTSHFGSQPLSSVRGLEQELKDKQPADPKLKAIAEATPRVDAPKGQVPVFHGENHVEMKKIGLGPNDLVTRSIAEKLLGDHSGPYAKSGGTTTAGIQIATTNSALATSAPTAVEFLSAVSHEGIRTFDSSNLSAQVAGAPSLFIPPSSDVTGAHGAWVLRSFGLFAADVEFTVGVTGEFSTLNKALAHLSAFRARYEAEGIIARIRILDDGWVMAEQVIANNGVDLSWIEIVSDQASTPIQRSSLTRSNTDVFGASINIFKAAFMAGNGASLPRIGAIFAMDASGSVSGTGQCGLVITRGARAIISPGAGFYNCTGLGAHVSYGGMLIAPSTVWTGNGTSLDPYFAGAVRTDQMGTVNLVQANIHDNPGQGVMINGASSCSVRGATITACGMDGLQTGGASMVHARDAVITNNGGTGLYASEGSSVRLLGTTITGNTNNGILIDSGARVNGTSGDIISNNGGYGIRCKQSGKYIDTAPTIQNNTLGGCWSDGGDIDLTGGTITGHPAGKDLIAGGCIYLNSFTLTTSSGNTALNNVTDSNVTAFNVRRAGGLGGIFGRGGASSNRGTATVAAGNTTIVVTHGVDFTPLISEVLLTRKNAGGADTKFWPSTMTATQFTINVDVAPGGGGADFNWAVVRRTS